jgi:hypothetical protein
MYSSKNADDRVAIVQMNADLRHAQLDLLSAQCATDRLRLRFSIEDLAQYGERDVLRKAIGTAVALSDFYVSIQNQLPSDSLPLSESQVRDAVKTVSDYLWKERETYRQKSTALTDSQKSQFEPFFSKETLDRVRTVELHGKRVSPPPFYMQAQVMGIDNLPAITHMASLTFVDVIVFNVHCSMAWCTRCNFIFSDWNGIRTFSSALFFELMRTFLFHSKAMHSRWSRSSHSIRRSRSQLRSR